MTSLFYFFVWYFLLQYIYVLVAILGHYCLYCWGENTPLCLFVIVVVVFVCCFIVIVVALPVYCSFSHRFLFYTCSLKLCMYSDFVAEIKVQVLMGGLSSHGSCLWFYVCKECSVRNTIVGVVIFVIVLRQLIDRISLKHYSSMFQLSFNSFFGLE